MSARKRHVESPSEPTPLETFSKALKREAQWPDKDEFLDVIYWMRQIIGVVIGFVLGLTTLKGFFGFLIFFALNVVVVYLYCQSYQRVDEEEFGGLQEILKEGLMTSFSSFLVAWIIVYSATHHS